MRRNPVTRQMAIAREVAAQAVRRAAGPPTAGLADETSAGVVGHCDPDSGAWRRPGISNVTSTAEPFYSARG